MTKNDLFTEETLKSQVKASREKNLVNYLRRSFQDRFHVQIRLKMEYFPNVTLLRFPTILFILK